MGSANISQHSSRSSLIFCLLISSLLRPNEIFLYATIEYAYTRPIFRSTVESDRSRCSLDITSLLEK